jgi:hypothetical protein
MLAILRLGSEIHEADEWLTWLPSSLVEAVWRRGELRRGRKKPSATSGCNVLLGEDEDPDACMRAAETVLSALRPQLLGLCARGVNLEVDLSVDVGPCAAVSRRVDPSFLQLLVDIGAVLVVSAYASPE